MDKDLNSKVRKHFAGGYRWELWDGDLLVRYGVEATLESARRAGKVWLHLLKQKEKPMEDAGGVPPGKSSYAHCRCGGCFETIVVNDIDAHAAGTNPPEDAYCEDCLKAGCTSNELSCSARPIL